MTQSGKMAAIRTWQITVVGSCCLAGSKWRGHLLFFNRQPNVGIIHWISPCDERIVRWNQSEPTADSRLSVTRTTYVKSWNPSDSADCCMLGALSPPRVIHGKVVCTEPIMTPNGFNRYIHCVSIWILAKQKSCTGDSRVHITGCNGLKQRVVFLIAEHATLVMTVSNKGHSLISLIS